MQFIKPKKLKPGDAIAVLSPSWGGPSVYPNIYKEGIRVLQEELGLRVKEFKSTRAEAAWLHQNPKARAEDINQAFADQEVKAILATIGGDDSVRILPYLDLDVICANPKIIMGYSDTSTLLTWLNQQGLVTFHGPSVMAGFSQWSSLPQQFQEHVRRMLFHPLSLCRYTPYAQWHEGYPEWREVENIGLVNPAKPNNDGWQWLQGDRSVEGELFGGSLEVLEMMKGSLYWPADDFWQGKIFFLETSENVPPPQQVKYILRNYGMQGVLGKIGALLFGRARGYSAEMNQELYGVIVSVVRDEFGQSDLPIVVNMDFGHTDPQFILTLGIRTKVDASAKTIVLLESPLS